MDGGCRVGFEEIGEAGMDVMTADAYQELLRIQAENEQRKKPKREVGHPEADLQKACVDWFRRQYPKHWRMLFAVPNGGSRNKAEAVSLLGQGVVPGVSDLILLEARGGYGALCIELKTTRKGSKQSDKQEAWQRDAESFGNKYVVVRTFEEFEKAVNDYMSMPLTVFL